MPKKRSNGEGTLRLRADGRWESAIMDGFRMDGKPHMKYFYGKTQKEVKEKVRAWELERASGIDIAQEYTFSQWSNIWFEGHKDNIAATTQEGYKYTLRILKDYFGDRRLNGIKAFDIEEFLKKLRREGASKSRMAGCRGMLYQIFHKAEANDLIHKNPVRFADKMRNIDPGTAKECFTAEEVKLLMANLPQNRIGASIRLMLGTGMRSQEILALEPKHIA
jgi:integrase